MKKQGIVTEYDGYAGTIKDLEGNSYLFLKKQSIQNIKEKDEVIFNSEIVETSTEDRKVARFVKKIKNS